MFTNDGNTVTVSGVPGGMSHADRAAYIADLTDNFCYYLPLEKFLYRSLGRWDLKHPVGKEGIRHHLLSLGFEDEDVASVLKSRRYTLIHGIDVFPGQGELVVTSDRYRYINEWQPPSLQPAPGTYPTIERLLERTTKGDEGAQDWLVHWMAAKVQDPCFVPKVAVVVTGEPGSGKDTLARILRLMLGEANCEVIDRAALENRFNQRWIGKLFIFANEVVSAEDLKSISEKLKILIDANEVEHEAKGKDQRVVRNRSAWMFASNDRVAPVVVEKGDRRYTVLSNHDEVPQEHRDLLTSAFEDDRRTPTPVFLAEVAAFWHDLLAVPVDRSLISLPYGNAARDALIESSLPAHELFIQMVNEGGLDDLLEAAMNRDFTLQQTRAQWDHGAEGVGMKAIYAAYKHYCESTGRRPLAQNKLGVAINKRPHPWEHRQLRTSAGPRVYAYVVPRKQPA